MSGGGAFTDLWLSPASEVWQGSWNSSSMSWSSLSSSLGIINLALWEVRWEF